MQEGGTQWKATVQSEHGASSLCRRVREGGRDGTTRFNNVLGIRVQEFTCASETQLRNAPKTKEKWKSGSYLKLWPWLLERWSPWMGLKPTFRQLGRSKFSSFYLDYWKSHQTRSPGPSHVPSVLQYTQPIMRERWYNQKVGGIFMSNPLPKLHFLKLFVFNKTFCITIWQHPQPTITHRGPINK